MNRRTHPAREKGATLTELLIGLSVATMVTSSVFAGLSQYLLFATQDEISQNLRDDLYLTSNNIRRDIRLATNVVGNAGTRTTSGTTICLRQPRLDQNFDLVVGEFDYVTYTLQASPTGGQGGLLREVWDERDDGEPSESQILNENIVTVGFLFGGKSILSVENLTLIRDVEMILISARETGLSLRAGQTTNYGDYLDVEELAYMAQSGIDFSYLRAYIDYMNSVKVDVSIASSMGAATVRNKNSMGIQTIEAPGGSS